MTVDDPGEGLVPPRLHTVGSSVVDERGREVVLRGVTMADPFFLADPGLSNHFCEADFSVLAAQWKAGIVRLPVHPDLFQHDPSYMERLLDPAVEWAGRHGLYVLLDWHAHGNPLTGKSERSDRAGIYPWHGNPCNADLGLARSALTALAGRYGENGWVLFEPFNEPIWLDWGDWRPVAEDLVDTIHAAAPGAVVVVSGTDWGYDLEGALSDPVDRDNVIYSTHPYPGKGSGWKRVVRKLLATSPVIIGEWGFRRDACRENLDGTVDGYARPLLAFADETGIGWIGWVWHPFWEPPMLLSWDGYRTTEFGEVVRAALAGR
jgi:endoglucanase